MSMSVPKNFLFAGPSRPAPHLMRHIIRIFDWLQPRTQKMGSAFSTHYTSIGVFRRGRRVASGQGFVSAWLQLRRYIYTSGAEIG